jgi:hypothetical protein
MHQALLGRLFNEVDVDGAPGAGGFARGEADGVAGFVGLLRTPSIQPKQRATSTDSGQVILGLPELFLWNPTKCSESLS